MASRKIGDCRRKFRTLNSSHPVFFVSMTRGQYEWRRGRLEIALQIRTFNSSHRTIFGVDQPRPIRMASTEDWRLRCKFGHLTRLIVQFLASINRGQYEWRRGRLEIALQIRTFNSSHRTIFGVDQPRPIRMASTKTGDCQQRRRGLLERTHSASTSSIDGDCPSERRVLRLVTSTAIAQTNVLC